MVPDIAADHQPDPFQPMPVADAPSAFRFHATCATWGSMTLLEDEVILAYAEDVRHCVHIFAPSAKRRGYFVLNNVARGSCFKDGCRDLGRSACS